MGPGRPNRRPRDYFYGEVLRLPPGTRDPDHYTLLGLPFFEEDHDAILRAALERTRVLEACQADPRPAYRQAATRLIADVREARMALLDPQRRREYDAALIGTGSREPEERKPIAPLELAAGAMFAGRYRVLGEARRGGLGVVYEALDSNLRTRVHLSVLGYELSSDRQARRAIEQAARSAAQLDHPCIVRVDEVGEASGLLFLRSRSPEGVSLPAALDATPHRRFEPGRAMEVLRQLASALAFAQDQVGAPAGQPGGGVGRRDVFDWDARGLRYEVQPGRGHKTGFFCDQRENRLRLRRLARGRRVLDVCCYTGGFALNAAAGGAREVLAVDLDEEAVAMARRNADRNAEFLGAARKTLRFVHADAFSYLRTLARNGRLFELVVLDPPAFLRGGRDPEEARARYHDLNRLALELVAPEGRLLTCSCSGLLDRRAFQDIVRRAARRAGRPARLEAVTGAGPDHPVRLDVPEGEYLKALWLVVAAPPPEPTGRRAAPTAGSTPDRPGPRPGRPPGSGSAGRGSPRR